MLFLWRCGHVEISPSAKEQSCGGDAPCIDATRASRRTERSAFRALQHTPRRRQMGGPVPSGRANGARTILTVGWRLLAQGGRVNGSDVKLQAAFTRERTSGAPL